MWEPLAVLPPASSTQSPARAEVMGPDGGAGSAHCWLAPPLQVQISSWAPLVVLEAGSSRHLPEAGVPGVPFSAVQAWLLPPLQSQISTRDPLAVEPAPGTSRQW